MQEDIKILKELTEEYNSQHYMDMPLINGKQIQALENLLKGYRELEKQLDSSRKANELLNKTNNELRWEIRTTYSKAVNDIISKFNLGDDYIPKSKIKEKIEELEEERKKKDEENTIDVFYDQIDITHIIEVLQELLGDE